MAKSYKKILAIVILTAFFFIGGSLLTIQGWWWWADDSMPLNIKVIFLLVISIVFSFAAVYAPDLFRNISFKKKK